jgi:hypothetical protein
MADGDRNAEDPLKIVESWNDHIEREQDKFSEIMGDAGQRLASRLHKDGIGGRLQVSIPNKP